MLVVPVAFDQPDNAARVVALGVARAVPAHRYSAAVAARELRRLLSDGAAARRAEALARDLAVENGVAAACAAIDGVRQARARLPR
jgi:UDP:flavonoid glycosyltransferase YjiC (YdhE family)